MSGGAVTPNWSVEPCPGEAATDDAERKPDQGCGDGDGRCLPRHHSADLGGHHPEHQHHTPTLAAAAALPRSAGGPARAHPGPPSSTPSKIGKYCTLPKLIRSTGLVGRMSWHADAADTSLSSWSKAALELAPSSNRIRTVSAGGRSCSGSVACNPASVKPTPCPRPETTSQTGERRSPDDRVRRLGRRAGDLDGDAVANRGVELANRLGAQDHLPRAGGNVSLEHRRHQRGAAPLVHRDPTDVHVTDRQWDPGVPLAHRVDMRVA